MKTVLCGEGTEGGVPLVCKIYFKKDNKESSDIERNLYTKHLNKVKEIKELYTLSQCPNVSPTIYIIDNLV